jgi:hypothetical protein
MNREEAQNFAVGINNLCESGTLDWDVVDGLDHPCRTMISENSHYVEEGQVDESVSALGFIDIVKEEYLQQYVDFISQQLHQQGY